jgi:hypothetical protein
VTSVKGERRYCVVHKKHKIHRVMRVDGSETLWRSDGTLVGMGGIRY